MGSCWLGDLKQCELLRVQDQHFIVGLRTARHLPSGSSLPGLDPLVCEAQQRDLVVFLVGGYITSSQTLRLAAAALGALMTHRTCPVPRTCAHILLRMAGAYAKIKRVATFSLAAGMSLFTPLEGGRAVAENATSVSMRRR